METAGKTAGNEIWIVRVRIVVRAAPVIDLFVCCRSTMHPRHHLRQPLHYGATVRAAYSFRVIPLTGIGRVSWHTDGTPSLGSPRALTDSVPEPV